MTKLWSAWVRLFDGRETGEVLAIVRIGTGIAIFFNIFSAIVAGFVDAGWVDDQYGGFRNLGGGGGWLIEALGGPTPGVAWTLTIVSLIASIMLVVGFGSRLTPLILGQGILALSMANTHARGSYDALHSNILWLLVLSPATATWSVDCWLRNRSWSSSIQVASWPRLLIMFQLVAVYFFTALHKVSVDWLPGGGFGAVYYVLQMPGWHRFNMHWLAWIFPLTQVATLISWLFELTSPMLLVAAYFRRTKDRTGRIRRWINRYDLRFVYIAIGFGMHVSILLTMEVGPFSVATLALYPSLFTPDELRKLAQRFRKASSETTSAVLSPAGVLAIGGDGSGSGTASESDVGSNSKPNDASGS